MNSLCIKIYGIVQGVGFRPFVSRLADRLGIKGTVANKGSYVEIHACGENLNGFLRCLETESPVRSQIIEIESQPEKYQDYKDFTIIESERDKGEIFVSPDIAVCDECIKEL